MAVTALGVFRPGVHAATWNAVALGLTTSDGWRARVRRHAIGINNTNAYGDVKIDGIHRGFNMSLSTVLKEWNAAVQAAMYPVVSATPAVFNGLIEHVGYRDSDFWHPLILTAEAGSPAALVQPDPVFFAGAALLAPDNDLEFLFGPVEGDMPIMFDLYAYSDGSSTRLFEWGTPA